MREVFLLINLDNFKKNCNIPNLLSLFRIIIIGPFVYYFLKDDYIMAAIMIAISGLSDMFDGYIARKFDNVTKFGAMLDPIADKFTLAAVVVCLGIKIPVIMPIIVVLLGKEILMLSAGAILLKNHKTPPPAQWYGKLATIIFYISVVFIVLLKAVWGIENTNLIVILMCINVALMIFALAKYFILFLKIIRNDSDNATNNKFK